MCVGLVVAQGHKGQHFHENLMSFRITILLPQHSIDIRYLCLRQLFLVFLRKILTGHSVRCRFDGTHCIIARVCIINDDALMPCHRCVSRFCALIWFRNGLKNSGELSAFVL